MLRAEALNSSSSQKVGEWKVDEGLPMWGEEEEGLSFEAEAEAEAEAEVDDGLSLLAKVEVEGG